MLREKLNSRMVWVIMSLFMISLFFSYPGPEKECSEYVKQKSIEDPDRGLYPVCYDIFDYSLFIAFFLSSSVVYICIEFFLKRYNKQIN